MSAPRIFKLGPDGWEEPLAYYEHRYGEPLDDRRRGHAVEVAPGVHVTELSEGGGIGPQGQVATFGAKIAVWHEPALPAAPLREHLERCAATEQELGDDYSETPGETAMEQAHGHWGKAEAFRETVKHIDRELEVRQ